jgi:hypothetical protein
MRAPRVRYQRMRSATDGPPRSQPDWSWATSPAGCTNHVAVGCTLLCHWAASGFGPLDFELFLYFLNIFKFLQIEKFVYDLFELGKL